MINRLPTQKPIKHVDPQDNQELMRLENTRHVELSLQEMANHCTSCGDCVKPCALLRREGTPAAIAQRELSQGNVQKAFECSLCGLCDAVCPEKLSPSSMFLEMRRFAFSMGFLDIVTYKSWLNYENLGRSVLFRRDWIPEHCTTVFFPGCSLPGRMPDGLIGLFKKFRKIEPSAGLVLDCCGKISHDLGLEKNFSKIFRQLDERLTQHRIQHILTACPGCSKVLKRYGSNHKVSSIYEALAKSINLRPPRDEAQVVTVHDPCPTRFDTAQQQAVRALVENSGFKIEEMPASGQHTRCCGQGGMVEGIRPGTIAEEVQSIRIQASGHPLVTSCGACADSLSQAGKTAHLAELLAGDATFSSPPKSSAKRWLNRLRLRFARLT